MSNLIIVAQIKAVAGHEEAVKAGLKALVTPTLAEEGCIRYDLHQDQNDPCLFMFLEEWETSEHLQKHSESEHIKVFRKLAVGLTESRKLHFMNPL